MDRIEGLELYIRTAETERMNLVGREEFEAATAELEAARARIEELATRINELQDD